MDWNSMNFDWISDTLTDSNLRKRPELTLYFLIGMLTKPRLS